MSNLLDSARRLPAPLASRAGGAPSQDRRGWWVDRLVRLAGAILLALWIGRALPLGDPAAKARLCANALVPLGAVCLVALWLAPRRDGNPRVRRAWQHLAAAVTAWWIAGAVWELLGRPAVSVADLGQLLFFPLVLLGVFGFPASPLDRDARIRFWLDTGIVVAGGTAGVWYFTLWPVLRHGSPHLLDIVINAAYPIGDLVLLFAACAALLRGADRETRRALGWVAAGLIGRFAGDLYYGWQNATTGYEAGGVADLTWLTSVWVLAVGAAEQRRTAPSTAEAREIDEASPVSVLPYAAVIVAYALLAVATRGAVGSRVAGVVGSAIGVTGLVLARQYLATRDNLRLHRRHAAREATLAGEARFRSLVQHSSDVITVVDADGVVRYASPALERVLGVHPDAAVGRPYVDFVHEDDVAMALERFAVARRQAGTVGPSELRGRAADGSWRRLECMTTNLLDDPTIAGVVITVRDVTERAALQAQLVHQAFHDPLTGLANRTLFRDRVGHALARDGRAANGVAVLFLDVDDFKLINDSLGHAAGDRLLRAVAERLLNATRGCDTVARLGGDEFAVLLENARTEDDAVVVAERVVQALRTPIALDGQTVIVAASIGIAMARPEDGAEELLRNADMAMYKAKQRGAGLYETFQPAMHAALVDRMELESDLRRAVVEDACGEFRLHYQPIVELAGGVPSGVEALLRWDHPRRGLLAPLTFIPVAEATGLIVPLGRWVLRAACAQAAHWAAMRRRSGDATPLTVTVNLSARQLQEPSLVDDVRAALTEVGLPAATLVLEITESVIVRDAAAARERMQALKALGVRLAIDDFGTGYSSLGYLQRFPIDILKIDKAFVDEVVHGANGAALARTIVALGDSLRLHCIAEGIEHRDQRAQLEALGCSHGQGFLFARPLPPEELDAYLCAPALAI